jgi:hypothetical protein
VWAISADEATIHASRNLHPFRMQGSRHNREQAGGENRTPNAHCSQKSSDSGCRSPVPGRFSLRALVETQALIQEIRHAGIYNPVEDVVAVSPEAENAAVEETLKLVGHGLRIHPHGLRQVLDAELSGSR